MITNKKGTSHLLDQTLSCEKETSSSFSFFYPPPVFYHFFTQKKKIIIETSLNFSKQRIKHSNPKKRQKNQPCYPLFYGHLIQKRNNNKKSRRKVGVENLRFPLIFLWMSKNVFFRRPKIYFVKELWERYESAYFQKIINFNEIYSHKYLMGEIKRE